VQIHEICTRRQSTLAETKSFAFSGRSLLPKALKDCSAGRYSNDQHHVCRFSYSHKMAKSIVSELCQFYKH